MAVKQCIICTKERSEKFLTAVAVGSKVSVYKCATIATCRKNRKEVRDARSSTGRGTHGTV